MSTETKRTRKPRPVGRVGGSLARIIEEVDDIRLAMDQMAQDFEVIRRVWELRYEGHGPTEIERRLRLGAPWTWRTKRQIEEILRPADLRVADLARSRQGKRRAETEQSRRRDRGERDEKPKFRETYADYGHGSGRASQPASSIDGSW